MPMDVKTAIEKRRSIRKFLDKKVPNDLIMALIDAARLAPSGNNAQPARFYVIDDKDLINKIKEGKAFERDFVFTAPVIIICCTDPTVYPKNKIKKGLDSPLSVRAVRDISISAQNLVLRATELGLGTCYIGWRYENKLKKILEIPKKYIIPFAIVVGYSAEEPNPRPRKKLEEFIFNNKKYGQKITKNSIRVL